MAFRLMTYVFYLLYILSLERVSSLNCLSCDGISRPRNCDVVSTCENGEVCYAKSVEAHDGLKTFRLGCSRNVSHVCKDTAADYQCSECCDHELCNAELCGQPGYPAKRGPMCYSCSSRLDSQPCNIIDFCDDDEVCSLTKKKIFSDSVFTTGCSQKHICDLHSHSGIIVGRRAAVPYPMFLEDDLTPGNYRHCCQSDLCNTNHGIKGCTLSPCFNGGSCIDMVDEYVCSCPQGYTGRNCNLVVDECASSPCLNGGTCKDMVHGYSCSCLPGYKGNKCERDIDDCSPINPCDNRGICIDEVNGYHCRCPPGYDGRNCSNDVDECSPINPCLNGGTCIDEINGYHCRCLPGYDGRNCTKAHDCLDITQKGGRNKSGVYTITLKSPVNQTVDVYCDMDTDGGGWTVFQKRYNGTVDFNRKFIQYVNGFGNLHGEFWLGLKYVHSLSERGQFDLRIDLENSNGRSAYELFHNFSLSPSPKYTLQIQKGSGTVGDSAGLSYNNGSDFYTFDHDNSYKCALNRYSGWWYSYCTHVNLNGIYVKPPGTEIVGKNRDSGMFYFDFDGFNSLKSTKMMLRRRK